MPIVATATDIGIRNIGQIGTIFCRAAWANPYARLALTPAVLEAALLADLGISADIAAIAPFKTAFTSSNGLVRTYYDTATNTLWAMQPGGNILDVVAGTASTPTVPPVIARVQGETVAIVGDAGQLGGAGAIVLLAVESLEAHTGVPARVGGERCVVGAPANTGDVQINNDGTVATLAADAVATLEVSYIHEVSPLAAGAASVPADFTACVNQDTEYGGVDLSAAANHVEFYLRVVLT